MAELDMDWIHHRSDWIGWDECYPVLISNHCSTVSYKLGSVNV